MGKKLAREERHLRFETLQLHVGQEAADPATDSRAVPIYQTASYVFHDCEDAKKRFSLEQAGNIYGRLTNPTQETFEKRMAALEGGVSALAVASGAAAITYTFQNLAQSGDHIVAAKNIYGGTYNLLAHTLPEYGIETTFVDIFREDEIERAIKENTKAIFLETLGTPNSDVCDIEAQNLSAGTELHWAESLWTADILTGRHPGNSLPLWSPTPAITASVLQKRSARRRL